MQFSYKLTGSKRIIMFSPRQNLIATRKYVNKNSKTIRKYFKCYNVYYCITETLNDDEMCKQTN